MITIQIKIRKKLNFIKNVGSAVLWISQKVPPFFGLVKKIRHYFTKVSKLHHYILETKMSIQHGKEYYSGF